MKRQIFVIVTAIILLVAVATQTIAAQSIVYGDITGDNYVSVSDVIKLLQLIASDGISELTSAQKKAMDVDCDDYVSVSDCIRMLQYIANPGSIILGPEEAQDTTITVGEVSGKAGETVTVPVSISNNTGVAGATLTITYSPKLTLTSAVSGAAFGELDFTHTEGLHNPCNLMWDSQSGEASGDGVIANLTFTIPSSAKVGEKYEVKCSYRYGDVFNDNWDDLELVIVDGAITVK
ncbi:MAG: hypothetical protein IJO52_10425 [Clostridia bacterium]|nr:hypothetical protein [Clostridia bacterium]